MKKILILTMVMLLVVPSICLAVPGKDKVAHFGVGYIIDDQLQQQSKMNREQRLVTVATIGVIKEVTDSRFDWRDLGATVLGAVVKEIKWEVKF